MQNQRAVGKLAFSARFSREAAHPTVRAFARGFAIAVVPAFALTGVARPLPGQLATPYVSSYYPARYQWEFRRLYPAAGRLSNGIEYERARLFELLWTSSGASSARLEAQELARTRRDILVAPPRLPVKAAAVASGFVRLAPELQAMFDWGDALQRQLYDLWADESIPAAQKDARMLELLSYYRSREDLAVSARPRSMDLADGQLFSLAFRSRFPRYNGLVWAQHWLRVGLLEALLDAGSPAQRRAQVDAMVERFRQMAGSDEPESVPFLQPMTAAVSPSFARRYPEASTVLDNLHLLQGAAADILTSREVPRSAKRQELLRIAALFRSDTAFAVSYDVGLRIIETMGANNMGGPAVGFSAELARPTVPRGMSLAGMDGADLDAGAAEMAAMAGMPDATEAQEGLSRQQLLAIHSRMMADPVIRERVATDPVLQRILAGAGQEPEMPGMQHGDMPGMPGMQHGNMPAGRGDTNMTGGRAAGAATPQPMTEERRQAIEFMMRLLADSTVEARIQADPEFRALWTDPEVQRRLAELRRARSAQPTAPSTRPAPRQTTPTRTPSPAPPPHPHRP